MRRVTVPVKLWTRLSCVGLAVEPSLLGRIHEFPFEGHVVRVALPEPPAEQRESPRLEILSWRQTETDKIPIAVLVGDVDVTLENYASLEFPEPALEVNANAPELFSPDEVQHLDDLTASGGDLAEGAFARWLRVIRWRMVWAGLRRVAAAVEYREWPASLTRTETRKPLWHEVTKLTAHRTPVLSEAAWEDVGRRLATGSDSPLAYDLFLEGSWSLMVEDRRRAIVDFAASCEALTRGRVGHMLPTTLPPRVIRRLLSTPIVQMIDEFGAWAFGTSEWEGFPHKVEVKELFHLRNQLLHASDKQVTLPNRDELGRLQRIASAFLRLGDRFDDGLTRPES